MNKFQKDRMIYSGSILEDLAWQVEIGADEAVGDVAGLLHWKGRAVSPPLAEERLPKVSPTKPIGIAPVAPQHKVTVTPLRQTPALRQPIIPASPISVASLTELRSELDRFEGCDLKQMAINTVFADGNPDADIMVIGDAPAEAEDRQGLPFVGDAGQLLDKMLGAIGLDRTKVYLTNLVFWRPPGNRTPTDVEIAACLPFTEQHIALKRPKLFLMLGATVSKSLLRNRDPFSKIRGRWFEYTPRLGQKEQEAIRCLPIYHPSFLLRQPSAKRQAWEDLLLFQKEINKPIPLKNKE